MLSSVLKYVLLPISCVLLAILIIAIIWIIYRKMVAKKKQNEAFPKPKRTIITPPDFMIPHSLQTLTKQLPVQSTTSNNEKPPSKSSSSSNGRKTGITGIRPVFPQMNPSEEEVHVNMKRRGAAGIHNDLAEWHQLGLEKRFSQLSMLEVDHESSIASFSSAEMEKKARFSTSDVDKHPIRNTSAKERQRRISVAVFQTLKAEGKKVSLSKHTSLQDVGESEALAAALEAVHTEPSSSVAEDVELSGDSDSETANVTEDGALIAKRRVAGRRGKEKKRYVKTGKVCFSTQYFQEKKKLEIMVLRAFDLGKRKEHNELSPFVRLYLLPGKRQKQHTRVKRRTKEPYFNEKRVFYDLSEEDMASNRLKLKVYSRETIAKNELLGETEIALSSLRLKEKDSFSLDLFLAKQQSSTQILISLSHNAASSQLEVMIHKARMLPKLSTIGYPDTYCRLYLCQEDGWKKCETKIRRNSRNPVWDEKHLFDVITSSSNPLHTLSLVISLISHSIMGKDEIIGHVIFNLDSSQFSAVEHWRQVNDCPHESFTIWHTLLEPEEL